MEHRTAMGFFLALAVQRPLSANSLNGRVASLSRGGSNAKSVTSTGRALPPSNTMMTSSSMPVGASINVNLVDVDANLLHPSLMEDVEHHIQVASSVGVQQFVVPGSTVENSRGALDLALRKPNVVFPTAGVHPYHVEECGSQDEAMAAVAALARNENVRCVGECGLDYSEGFPAPELQLPWFERQVQIACQMKKPLFLHERQAFGPFTEVLRRYDSLYGLPPCLVHCFTGTADELAAYLEMGFFVGITGFICKDKHGQELREAVKHIPLDRLMVETDAPYLGFPGCRKGHSKPKQQSPNVPSALPAVVRGLADCLELSFDQIAQATTQNSRAFFGMADIL